MENIPGLFYVPNYLTKEEIKEVETLIKTEKWDHVGNNQNSRRVVHYGYIYAYDRGGVTKTVDVPEVFNKLVTPERVNKAIGKENLLKSKLDQLIINEYKTGQGIAPHIDHVKYFDSVIVCITLGSGVEINFYEVDKPNKIITVYVEPGSLYVMSGDSRYKWRHGIKHCKEDSNGVKRGVRVSLTYRTITDSYRKKDDDGITKKQNSVDLLEKELRELFGK